MTNDTTVSATAIGGALSVVTLFVASQLGLDAPVEVGGAVAVLFTTVAGLVLPR
jgi:hypothetical protein